MRPLDHPALPVGSCHSAIVAVPTTIQLCHAPCAVLHAHNADLLRQPEAEDHTVGAPHRGHSDQPQCAAQAERAEGVAVVDVDGGEGGQEVAMLQLQEASSVESGPEPTVGVAVASCRWLVAG